jgi:hypothetical protein
MSTRAFYVLRLKAFLTPTDLGNLAGYTKAQMCNLARENKIPGTRVNPGGKHYRFADTPKIRAWCAWKKRERERPRPRRSTAAKRAAFSGYWNLRGDAGGRHAKIHRLQDILIKQKPVGKVEKELALGYFDALAKLASQRIQPLTDFPLLEGVRALDHGTLFFRFTFPLFGKSDQILGGVNEIRGVIEALPIRPEARPHSAAASVKSQTKP